MRDAIDSDNRPIAWGDDDSQYTSYGDGSGFPPYTDKQLSMGFARVDGPASGFHGTNIRSATWCRGRPPFTRTIGGLGGTHGYRFPANWIGGGGDMVLVFSGVKLPNITYDAFCVRRMNLETK